MRNKIILIYQFILIGIFFLFYVSCKKEANKFPPTLTTIELSNITYNSATCGGNILSYGGATVTERGVCWSLNPNPTINDVKVPDAVGGTGNFIINLTGLTNNATLFARAYATNAEGTSYGEEFSFTLWLNEPDGTITDIDGNTYSTVRIGAQVWMKENLRVTHYRNGGSIPKITLQDDNQWVSITTGAFCDYNDLAENANIYGHLYNWHVVSDNRNICPTGWHIPTTEELYTLVSYLGGWMSNSGGHLKTIGEEFWQAPNNGATNLSGFSALPGGERVISYNTYSHYEEVGIIGIWWLNKSIDDKGYFWYIQNSFEGTFDQRTSKKNNGLSIRCIKD